MKEIEIDFVDDHLYDSPADEIRFNVIDTHPSSQEKGNWTNLFNFRAEKRGHDGYLTYQNERW